MKRSEFLQMLREKVLFLDGAYGTEFFKRGYKGLIELLNISKPEIVERLQSDYIQAGANILLTNTFSANRMKLRAHGFESEIEKINFNAVEIARSVCKNQLVFGDMSSTGSFVQPFGEISFDEVYEIFKEQASILIKAGVDGIIIETMSDLKELKAAILAVRDLSNDIPLIAHMTFEEDGKSVTGTSVEIFATLMNDLDVDVVGVNCSLEPKQMLSIFARLAKYSKKPLSVEPNAGKPFLENGKLSYRTTPEEFAVYMADFVELGANIIGGCCGTGPEHIKVMTKYIGTQKPRKREIIDIQYLSSRTNLKPIDTFLIIGERINASGKKKLQAQIQQRDFSGVLTLAQEQEQEGCTAIDINFGIEKLLRKEHFQQAIIQLDKHSCLPVSFDIQNLDFLEIAMKEYVGRGLINSAFAREDHLVERINLLKRYGGLLIVLAMEKDIPKTAEERFQLVLKAAEILKGNGVELDRVYFDPLVLPIGAKNDYHVTLKVIDLINKAGLRSSIGLSNLSFGMPNREHINAAFLALCVENGLNAAILNSKEALTMGALQGALSLQGKEIVKVENVLHDPLVDIIIKGQKEQLMNVVQELLKQHDPLYISQQVLAEAMKKIGTLYANGSIYLPHLILAAETVQPAFDYLNNLLGESRIKLGKILLATVQGDIHDIGKKIVATVLRSGGFEVYDIGKDVPAEKILQKCKEYNPDIVGLSAMMTTTVGQVKEVADLLRSEKINVFLLAGGASMNQQLADQFGVMYAKDAVQALEFCKKFVQGGAK
ncbi:homocysteine S-methyltransferase family protein [Thermotoga profunda]|uniref:homocysteine S-methyltransferase family protein n=1 Tax=Thermotoga profunda TaxID=1508420 RepID=UPI000596E78D|nr:homocysteine S-methyltransferase family protein [Thermotoga profunda]